ncbi:MAG TPA: hypothetical protein VGG74_00020 [Kofleriaceae bacterium]|jgi:hypothetical protein
MGRFVALLPFVVAFACSPHTPAGGDAPMSSTGDGGTGANDGAMSGTRLKLTYYAFTDGTTQWFGLYDSERKENCSPFDGTWPDGNTYCVPDWSGSVVYSDSKCTNPEIDEYVGSTCAAAPELYVLDQQYDECSEEYLPTHLYRKGSANGAAAYYVMNYDGTCSTQYTVDQGYEQVYAITSEVSTTDLVQLTLSPPTTGGPIGVRSWTSSDGAVLPIMLHDTTNNLDCSPEYYGDTATTASCAPNDAFDAYLDHDNMCVDPALDMTSTCAAPGFAYTYPSGNTCPMDLETYYAVGSKLATPTLFESFGTTCSSETPSTGTSYYGLGSALQLTALQRAPDTDAGHRIQLIHYGDSASLHYRDPTYLYDSQEQAVCAPEQLADGTIRCVPDSGFYVSTGFFYSDSGCATAVDVLDMYTGPATCQAPTVPAYVRKYLPTTGCISNFELHSPTTKAGTLYYLGGSDGVTCTKYVPDEEAIYNVGPSVSTSDFVTAVITTDN